MQLITRTPSTMDQRKIIIQLTDQGWAMRESAAEIPLKLMSKLNLEVSDVQIAEALHLKNKLYVSLHLKMLYDQTKKDTQDKTLERFETLI